MPPLKVTWEATAVARLVQRLSEWTGPLVLQVETQLQFKVEFNFMDKEILTTLERKYFVPFSLERHVSRVRICMN